MKRFYPKNSEHNFGLLLYFFLFKKHFIFSTIIIYRYVLFRIFLIDLLSYIFMIFLYSHNYSILLYILETLPLHFSVNICMSFSTTSHLLALFCLHFYLLIWFRFCIFTLIFFFSFFLVFTHFYVLAIFFFFLLN